MNKTVRIIVEIVLAAVIVYLGFRVYRSVMDKIDFDKEVKTRELKVIDKLESTKILQSEYFKAYGYYTHSFDTLTKFYNEFQIPFISKIGTTPDTLTEEDALKLGVIKRDTFFVAAKDTLFYEKENFDIHKLRYVLDTEEEFVLQSDTLHKEGYNVYVWMINVDYEVLLNGMKKQYVKNFIQKFEDLNEGVKDEVEGKHYAGLRMGSLRQASQSGNWK